MKIGSANGGETTSFDVLQNVATIGLVISCPSVEDIDESDKLSWLDSILNLISVSAEIVSNVNSGNKELFRDIPLDKLMPLVGLGSTFVSFRDGLLFVNIPICLEGALAFDKSTFLRFAITPDSDCEVHAIPSLTYGTEPIRVIKQTVRAGETGKFNLSGSVAILSEQNAYSRLVFKSVVGQEFELYPIEDEFVKNALGDIYAVGRTGDCVQHSGKYVILPTSLATEVKVHQGGSETTYYLLYDNYAVSDEVKCRC